MGKGAPTSTEAGSADYAKVSVGEGWGAAFPSPFPPLGETERGHAPQGASEGQGGEGCAAPRATPPLTTPTPFTYRQVRTYVSGPPPADARDTGRQTAHTLKEVQPQPTTYAPFLGAALSVDTATVAASPSPARLPYGR